MATTSAFSVIHVDGTAIYRRQRVFHETTFIQRIGVKLDLEIELVCNRQAGIDNGRHRAPVLMYFQAKTPSIYLVVKGLGFRAIAATEKAEIYRPLLGGL